jgi:hypothetical protein
VLVQRRPAGRRTPVRPGAVQRPHGPVAPAQLVQARLDGARALAPG